MFGLAQCGAVVLGFGKENLLKCRNEGKIVGPRSDWILDSPLGGRSSWLASTKSAICRPDVNHVDPFEARDTKNGALRVESQKGEARVRLTLIQLFGREIELQKIHAGHGCLAPPPPICEL